MAAVSGVAAGESISPRVVDLEGDRRSEWPLAEVVEATGEGTDAVSAWLRHSLDQLADLDMLKSTYR